MNEVIINVSQGILRSRSPCASKTNDTDDSGRKSTLSLQACKWC